MTEQSNIQTRDAAGSPPVDNATILVVDDEEMIRGLAAHALQNANYSVLTATSGDECLRLYRENPDVIALTMLDYSMPPGINGEETFNALLDLSPKAKVLLCSGSISPDACDRMIDEGLSGFLPKPYSPRRLVDEVHHILTKHIL